MKYALAALILTACALPASGACTTANCSEPTWRPSNRLQKCYVEAATLRVAYHQITAEVEELREEALELRAKVIELEGQLQASLEQTVRIEPAKAKPQAKKVRKVSRSKGCKKGRTRNSRGICGRWG